MEAGLGAAVCAWHATPKIGMADSVAQAILLN
jgi:hypothetical protein